jgi:hypothetical protein
VAGRGRAGRAYPLLGLGQDGPQADPVGDRRRHQPGVGERRERREHHAGAGRVDTADEQRTGGRGREETQQHGAQHAADPGVAGVTVDGQVTGAQQRDDRREAGVVERLGGADADERGDRLAAEWCVFEPGVELAAEPARGQRVGRGAQLLGEVVLLALVGDGCAHGVEGDIGRGQGRRCPAVQCGGLAGPSPCRGHTAHLLECDRIPEPRNVQASVRVPYS